MWAVTKRAFSPGEYGAAISSNEPSSYSCKLWKQTPPFETFSHSTTWSACAGWRTHALKLTRMRTWRRLLTGRPFASSSRTVAAGGTTTDGVALDGAMREDRVVAGGSGAVSTAVALATTGET